MKQLEVVEHVAMTTIWDPLMDVRGLAAYSTLSPRLLQDLLVDVDDPIPSYRVRNRVLIRKSDFDAWLSRRRNTKARAVAQLAEADARALLSRSTR